MIRRPVSKMDLLAEELANGASVPEAAKTIGVEYAYGNALFQRIRKSLGEQAI